MEKGLYLLICSLFFTPWAYAINISSDTSYGGYTQEEVISADGIFGKSIDELESKKPRGNWVWTGVYTFDQTSSYDSNANLVTDQTSEIILTTGLKVPLKAEYGMGLNYANTPQEYLKSYGPTIYCGHTFELGKQRDDFTPTLGLKLTLTALAYVQTFSTDTTTRTKKLRPTTGSSSITQSSALLETTWDLFDPLTFKLNYTIYGYNHNVSDFLNTLDSARAVSAGNTGLSNAVSGFSFDMKEVDINWFPFDNWEFDEQATESTNASDGSASWSFKEGLIYNFSKNFRTGLSQQFETSETLTDHIYTLTLKYLSN
jgi:hypothetical protein